MVESEAKTSEVPDLLRKGKEEISKRRLNWLQILVTAVVTGGVTIATGLILSHFQAREPYLVYSTTDTIPFLGHNQVLAIYQVSIGNEGKKAVEDVNCIVNIPGAAIEQKRITADPVLSYSESVAGQSLKLSFPLLNPSELVHVSILATAPTQLPNRPQVSLRGKGVSGQEKKIEQEKTWNPRLSIIAAILGVFSGFLSILLFRRDFRMEIFGLLRGQSEDHDKEMVEEQQDQEFHADDQRRILSYLCGIHGLDEDAAQYLTQIHEATYWSESDRLTLFAITSKDIEKVKKVKSVLRDLLDYAQIANISRAIINYNLARIALTAGDLEEMRELVNLARGLAPKLINKRLKLDPLFKRVQIEPQKISTT